MASRWCFQNMGYKNWQKAKIRIMHNSIDLYLSYIYFLIYVLRVNNLNESVQK